MIAPKGLCLPPIKARILEAVKRKPGISAEELRCIVWADDPNGGPEDRKVLHVHVAQLNRLLALARHHGAFAGRRLSNSERVMNPARARYLAAITELADAFVEITVLNPAHTRYLAAIAELADVIVEIPLDDLPPYHRDLQAAINQRNPDFQQALGSHANQEFLDTILDLKGIDEQRFPRGRWQGSEKPGSYWKGCSARQQRVLQRARGEEENARCRFPDCECTREDEPLARKPGGGQ